MQAIVVRAIKSQVLVARKKSYFTITFDGVEIYFEWQVQVSCTSQDIKFLTKKTECGFKVLVSSIPNALGSFLHVTDPGSVNRSKQENTKSKTKNSIYPMTKNSPKLKTVRKNWGCKIIYQQKNFSNCDIHFVISSENPHSGNRECSKGYTN